MSDSTRSKILTHPLSRRSLIKQTAATGAAAGLALPASARFGSEVAAQETGGTFTGTFYQSIPNPWQMSGTAVWTSLVFETLVAWDENYSQIVPSLAESWTAAEDGLSYTFTLRQGVTWHDGQPFTAADVVWSYTTLLHPAVSAASGSWLLPNLMLIKGAEAYNSGAATELPGVTAPDDHTVAIALENASPLFLNQMAMPWILPKHLLESVPLDDKFFEAPYFTEQLVGLGPFKFSEWERDQFITVIRHEGYYRGAPKLASIVGRDMELGSVAILSQQNGELDAVHHLSPDDVATVQKDTNLDVFPGPPMVLQSMGVGNKPEILKDKRMRQAILYAIDRETITTQLFKGAAQVVNSPFVVDWVPMDEVNPYAYNPDTAKALLAEVGYDGEAIDIWAYYTDQFTGQLLAAFQQYLGDVGIKTNVLQADWANLEADYNAGNFGLMYQGSSSGPDPDAVYIYFHSKSEYNTLYSDPKVDELLDAGRSTLDQAERATIYSQLAVQLADLSFWLALWTPLRFWSVTKTVTGVNGKMGTPGLHIPFYTQAETWTKA
jgi:peptide/nickel transport system substrate-binding protein